MRSLWRASIWHPDAIPPDEWKYRNLKRVWLPAYDLLIIIGGIIGATASIPALDLVFPAHVVDVLGIVLTLVAIVCLVGVCFPRLWALEIIGKAILIGILASYAIAIVLLAGLGEGHREFIAFVVLSTLPLPLYRMSLLGEEIRERRAA